MGWLLSLMAQTPTPSLPVDLGGGAGTAGWVGTGILSGVLSWLLFVRMPAWDKMMEKKDAAAQAMLEAKDKQINAIVAQTQAMLEAKDKQVIAIIESRDLVIKAIAEGNNKTVKDNNDSHDMAFSKAEVQRRADFQVALETITNSHSQSMKTVVDHCEREITTLRESAKESNALMRESIKESTAVMVDFRMALEELRETGFQDGGKPKPP